MGWPFQFSRRETKIRQSSLLLGKKRKISRLRRDKISSKSQRDGQQHAAQKDKLKLNHSRRRGGKGRGYVEDYGGLCDIVGNGD